MFKVEDSHGDKRTNSRKSGIRNQSGEYGRVCNVEDSHGDKRTNSGKSGVRNLSGRVWRESV